METRTIAGILLSCGGDVLMMRRSTDAALSPGQWANIGGHVEPHEKAWPKAAALRELKEEAGYEAHEINGLFLRYIVLHKTADELRVFYDFTATAMRKPLPHCPEGTLHWVNKKDLLSLDTPATLRLLLEHYTSLPLEKKTLLGIVEQTGGVLNTQWHEV